MYWIYRVAVISTVYTKSGPSATVDGAEPDFFHIFRTLWRAYLRAVEPSPKPLSGGCCMRPSISILRLTIPYYTRLRFAPPYHRLGLTCQSQSRVQCARRAADAVRIDCKGQDRRITQPA